MFVKLMQFFTITWMFATPYLFVMLASDFFAEKRYVAASIAGALSLTLFVVLFNMTTITSQ